MLKIIISDPGAFVAEHGNERYVVSTTDNNSTIEALPIKEMEDNRYMIYWHFPAPPGSTGNQPIPAWWEGAC